METEWAKMSEQERGEFAAWKTMKQQQADAKALAEAEAAAAPKRFDAMSEPEKRAWLRQQGISIQGWAKV